MATFPTLSKNPSTDYDENFYKPSVRTEFDGNYTQERPKYTRATNTFNLKYKFITEADKATLKTFFADNKGGEFDWVNPLDTVTYTVRFKQDRLNFKLNPPVQFTVSLILEEV